MNTEYTECEITETNTAKELFGASEQKKIGVRYVRWR